MKARIVVMPKKAVLDPQGKTVQTALAHMGYTGIGDVRVGNTLKSSWLAPTRMPHGSRLTPPATRF